MATDFWASSHYKRWIVTRAALIHARAEDARYVDRREYLDYLGIYFANVITKLGKKLQFRQRVIATATVFFRRFYLKNSYCETDPFIVIAACCYVAAKAEEYPVHIKLIVSESRALFSQDMYGVKNFPSDNTKIAEMEFYLVNDLECDLIVFHPYRTLLALCKRQATQGASPSSEEGEADDLGIGLGADDGPRYWGTGEGQLELTPSALQTAWSIINDTYRSQLCVLYPPHMIAIAAIYLTFILHPPPRPDPEPSDSTDASNSTYDQSALNTKAPPRRSSRHSQSSPTQSKKTTQDPINFFADLNVSLPLVATIAQEIISLYTLWGRYKEDLAPEHHKYSNRDTSTTNASSPLNSATNSATASPLKRARSNRTASGPMPISIQGTSTLTPIIIFDDNDNSTPTATGSPADSMSANTPGGPGAGGNSSGALSPGAGSYVTPFFLSAVLKRMRENRLMDIARSMAGGGDGHVQVHGGMSGGVNVGQVPGSSGMQTQGARAINKRLERTQAAG